MTTREKLHCLIDELPKSELHTAERFLVYLWHMSRDPVLRALLEAPLDDEPETEDERAAVQEARNALARGDTVTDQELRRTLGLGQSKRRDRSV